MGEPEFIIKRSEEILEEAGLEGLLDFSFNKLSGIKIIKVLYVVGIVLACLLCAVAILTSIPRGASTFIITLVVSPIITIVEILFLRVILEVIVAVFNIDKNLKQLTGNSQQSAVSSEQSTVKSHA